jgi:NAD-dependent SIR2 family protein deacetylase
MIMDIKKAFKKSLFLLGAGVSCDAGCKLSRSMLEDLKTEITKDDSIIFETSAQKEALKFLLSCLDYHNSWRSFETNNKFYFSPNIEELALLIRRVKNRENFLPYPITGNWADKLSALESEFKGQIKDRGSLFESLDNILKQILLREWLAFEENKLDFLKPMKTMFEEFSTIEFEVEFFSLNNDLVIETYFGNHNMLPRRGFNNNDWRGMDFRDTEDIFGKINLYKLHGSLDWVRLDTGEVKIKESCTDSEKEMIDLKHDPYVIFGHGAKTFSVDPFFSLIHNFKNKLAERDFIFVIGYSFFDPYINNLLIEAINKGGKKLIIVNPDFGPNIDYEEQPVDYLEAKSKNGEKVDKKLVDYIEAIQKNPFYSELPEFNIYRINGEDVIFYIKQGVAKFLDYFFSNGGSKFISIIEHFEEIKRAEESPF